MPTNQTLSKTTLVKAIFTNLLFVVGVILMVVGFVRGSSTIAKFAFFDHYPLQGYEESRCEYGMYTEPIMPKTDTAETTGPTQQEREQEKNRCLKELEHSRSVKKVEDVVGSLSFFVAGAALTFAFKQFIFGKK